MQISRKAVISSEMTKIISTQNQFILVKDEK